ncbi:MAG: SGNH/GDSL hydrolase family protein [Chitinophagaceae bacterium]|nr:SGNH/GDSL hydrolase family protein [Chitinophagaceae bacterium]
MYTYLALGDSYTIGEQVPASDNFPNQTTRLLRSSGIEVVDPVIIATTGWTTDELAASIREHNIRDTFSFVTLLIGVNNQYRGRSIENYEEEFLQLLHTAIGFAGNNTNRVFVLSIPDWGVTPFAADRDRAKVASEIDAYNASCRRITLTNGCHHLDITDSTRLHGNDAEYLVADELHPSGKEYAIWAERLTKQIKEELTK